MTYTVKMEGSKHSWVMFLIKESAAESVSCEQYCRAVPELKKL